MQIERQWMLLKSIPDQSRPKSTEDLWRIVTNEESDISKRTVERDLSFLSSIFPIGQRTEGRTNFWFWESGAKMWLPGITDDEALAWHMADRNLRALLPEASMERLAPYFSAARERLDSSTKNVRSWTKKFRLIAPGPYRQTACVFPKVVRTIRDALLRDQQLNITVHKDEKNRFGHQPIGINPLAIIQQGVSLCLVFNVQDSEVIQHLSLNHITHAEVSISKFDGVVDFDPDAYIRSGALTAKNDSPIPIGSWIDFCGVFERRIGLQINESPISSDHWCQVEDDGRIRIRATMIYTNDFLSWLLSMGADVCILEPVSLRLWMANQIARMSAQYEGISNNETPQRTLTWLQDWSALCIKCERCHWTGQVKKSHLLTANENSGSERGSISQFRCPKCSKLLLNIDYQATQSEIAANWETLNEGTKAAVLSSPDRMRRIEDDKLKFSYQLQDLKPGPDYLTLKVTWHPEGEVSFSLWHGIRFVWIQPAQWGGHSEFFKMAQIIKDRYGELITDIRLTPQAHAFLIGGDPDGQIDISLGRALLKND